jgi:hypothetical protein
MGMSSMHIKRQLTNLFVAVLGTVFIAQVSMGKTPPPDPLVIQAFMVEQCPSDIPVADAPQPHVAGVLTSLIGLGIDSVLDALGKALSDAADADKNGVAKSARAPAYLYHVEPSGDAKKKDAVATRMMQCIVIANAPNGPDKWCKNAEMGKLPVCAKPQANGTLKDVLKEIDGVSAPNGSGDLAFYAEIRLQPATDLRGFIPVLNALYYPASVNTDVQKFAADKERNLSITVTGSTPSGESALSAVHAQLQKIVPRAGMLRRGNSDADKILLKSLTPLWVGVVKTPEFADIPGGEADHRAFPINLSIELREIGDPNAFLQLLAKAFNKYKSNIGDELKSKVPETAAAAASTKKQADMDATAKLQSAIGTAYQAIGGLETACTKPTSAAPTAGQTAVLQQWYTAAAAVEAVRKLEAVSGTSANKFTVDPNSPPGTSTAYEFCKSFKG